MEKETYLITLAAIILAYVIGWVSGCSNRRTQDVVIDTTHTIIYDTLKYYDLVPRDSVVIRYETHTLALAPTTDSALGGFPVENTDTSLLATVPCESSQGSDSATVVIPITQKVYEDSLYTAYVSGYQPSLDSISLRIPTHTYNITTRIREKSKRFGIGPQIGIGVGKDGSVTPYIGIGIHFDILNF